MNRRIVAVIILAFLAGMPVGAFLNYWQVKELIKSERPLPQDERTVAARKEKEALDAMREAAQRTAARMNALDELESPNEVRGKAVGQPAAPRATVFDSDFESDLPGGLPASWRGYAQRGVAMGEKPTAPIWATRTSVDLEDGLRAGWDIFKTAEAHNGENVLRLSLLGPTGQRSVYRLGVTRTFQADTGKKYAISFFARAGAQPVQAGVRYGIAPAVKSQDFTLSEEWKGITVLFIPETSGDQGLTFLLKSPGEMWLDDIRVQVRD